MKLPALVTVLAACAPYGPPPCDSLCEQQQRLRAAQDEFYANRARRRYELAVEEEQAKTNLANATTELAQAQQERMQAEARALAALNEARVRAGLPPLSRWSSDPGGLTSDGALLIFGGKDHKTFLGCLCDAMEPESVISTTGKFGPSGDSFSQDSIWNKYSDYGSSYSDLSPCSTLADHPPVVVSKEGRFFGYLTVNSLKSGAISDPDVVSWLKDKVCQ